MNLTIRSACFLILFFVHAAHAAEVAPNATVASSELRDFDKQPKRVRELIETLLDLTKRGLTYKYGSADPKQGGMDCSGAMYYALRKEGFKDVPRVANMQYRWIWQSGTFNAVLSSNPESFELSRLRPGDMLFWSGTYDVDRDPPVTHSMIFLGWLKDSGRPVMVGASNGRSYQGKARNGVSVFDFKLPKASSKSRFVGYGSLPGVRR